MNTRKLQAFLPEKPLNFKDFWRFQYQLISLRGTFYMKIRIKYYAVFRLSAGKSQKNTRMLVNANTIEEKRC